jgi:hypothetical protein
VQLTTAASGNSAGAAVDASAFISGEPDVNSLFFGPTAGGTASASVSGFIRIRQSGFFSIRSIFHSSLLTSSLTFNGYELVYITGGASVGTHHLGGLIEFGDESSWDQNLNVFLNEGDVLPVSAYVTATASVGAIYPDHPVSKATANARQTSYLVITPISVGAAYESLDGTDWARLPSDVAVQYRLSDFGYPTKTKIGIIRAIAGQVIPITWRVTDLQGNPVGDPLSFTGLFSFQTTCSSGGDIEGIEEGNASGSSGLQDMGDGYWQFNWKTNKSYTEQCRRVYVTLKDGQSSEQVEFWFK